MTGVMALMFAFGFSFEEGGPGNNRPTLVIVGCCIASVIGAVTAGLVICWAGDEMGANVAARLGAGALGYAILFSATTLLSQEIGSAGGPPDLADNAATNAALFAGIPAVLMMGGRTILAGFARQHPYWRKLIGRRNYADVELALVLVSLASVVAGARRVNLYEQWLADLREIVLEQEFQDQTAWLARRALDEGGALEEGSARRNLRQRLPEITRNHLRYALGCVRAAVRMRIMDAGDWLGRQVDRLLASDLAVGSCVLVGIGGTAFWLYKYGGMRNVVENAENIGAIGTGLWAAAVFTRRVRGIRVKANVRRRSKKIRRRQRDSKS